MAKEKLPTPEEMGQDLQDTTLQRLRELVELSRFSWWSELISRDKITPNSTTNYIKDTYRAKGGGKSK